MRYDVVTKVFSVPVPQMIDKGGRSTEVRVPRTSCCGDPSADDRVPEAGSSEPSYNVLACPSLPMVEDNVEVVTRV